MLLGMSPELVVVVFFFWFLRGGGLRLLKIGLARPPQEFRIRNVRFASSKPTATRAWLPRIRSPGWGMAMAPVFASSAPMKLSSGFGLFRGAFLGMWVDVGVMCFFFFWGGVFPVVRLSWR